MEKKSIQLFFSVLLMLSAPALAQPQLSVTGNSFEGSALFIRLSGVESEAPPKVTLEGETYQAVPSEQGFEIVVPLSIDSGGSQTLVVETDDGQRWSRTLQVKTRHYGHQSISLSPSTLAGYDNPQNKADDAAILKVLQDDSEPRLFTTDFRYPVEAPQTTGFGLRRTYNGWKKGWHKGLDLAGWEGQPVKAPAPGLVLHTARGLVNGNTVVLSHGAGVGSSYLHLNSIQVKPGQRVKAGTVIGTVGGTGGFAPHLHWEVRVQGVPVHPKVFFQLPSGWLTQR